MNRSENSDDRETRIDDALAEFMSRIDRGESVSIDAFLREYSELAIELRPLLETAGLIERVAGPDLSTATPLVPGAAPKKRDAGESIGDNASAEAPPCDSTVEPSLPQDPSLTMFPNDTSTVRGAREAPKQFSGDFTLANRVIGDYELFEMIGTGGMGVVYRARQISLNRTVAVKMILTGNFATQSEVERFRLEAKAAAKLNHQHIVSVYQIGEIDGQHFFSMEYIQGKNLSQLARQEQIAPERIARYLKTLADAVQYAHDCKVVHRDLKPANIIIDDNDRPLITDFGLAKDFELRKHGTATGASIGTPAYMSPEQAAGKGDLINRSADIYSLGAILYELLTGQPPFKRSTMAETILDVIHNEPRVPHALNSNVDRRLEAICLKCLRKDPRQRYSSATELAADLQRYLNGEPVEARGQSIVESCWYWLRNVPMIGALAGRRVNNATTAHRVFQWSALTIMALSVLATIHFAAKNSTDRNLSPDIPDVARPYPESIRIATGKPGGEYASFSASFGEILEAELGKPVQLRPSFGSVDNRQLLVDYEADLSLLQTSTITDGHLAIIAPLYTEDVFFVARRSLEIQNIDEFAALRVIIGEEGSGMQVSARRVLDALDIRPSGLILDGFERLTEPNIGDAAIVTSGIHNPEFLKLLSEGEVEVISLTPDQVELLEQDIVFRSHRIPPGLLATDATHDKSIPPHEILTIKTTTFLVTQHIANHEFVDDVLRTLYASAELIRQFDLVSPEEAAAWAPLPLHAASMAFYRDIRRRQGAGADK